MKARDKTIRFFFFQKSYSNISVRFGWKGSGQLSSQTHRSWKQISGIKRCFLDSLLYWVHICIQWMKPEWLKDQHRFNRYKFTRFVFREHPSCLINFTAWYDALSVTVYVYVNYRASIVTLVPDNHAFVQRNL